jgi:hypothetical protein
MLKMKKRCEKCAGALAPQGLAFICSFECTFCATCTHAMQHVCPNCQGELVQRPTRVRAVADVAAAQLRTKLGKLFS